MYFKSGKELVAICKRKRISISEAVVRYEMEYSDLPREEILERMEGVWEIARQSVKNGLAKNIRSVGGQIGGNAYKMIRSLGGRKALGGRLFTKAAAYALAVTEVNASMGRIVAAPTAGSSGVMPGGFLAVAEERRLKNKIVLNGLFTAAGIGIIIAKNATLSGAEGGCQAEVGSASAMTAAGLTEMLGGKPECCLHAAAMALKNVLGLVCDPVAGLVEVPCSKRNVIGVADAIMSAQMSLSGIKSVIPFDEVVGAMYEIGRHMPETLRETAKGGLAITPTAEKIKDRIFS